MSNTKLIHNIDPEIWVAYTSYCRLNNKKAGVLLNDILVEYLNKKGFKIKYK